MNLDKIIKYNIVKYIENKKRENINLKMYIKTINVLLKKQFIDRSCKNVVKNKSNSNFAISSQNLA